MTIVARARAFDAGPLIRLDTHAVHAGRSTTYPLPSVDGGGAAYEQLATGGRPEGVDSLVYQRLWNPNVDRFERAVARLEGMPGAVALATGMAALSTVLVATVAAGGWSRRCADPRWADRPEVVHRPHRVVFGRWRRGHLGH